MYQSSSSESYGAFVVTGFLLTPIAVEEMRLRILQNSERHDERKMSEFETFEHSAPSILFSGSENATISASSMTFRLIRGSPPDDVSGASRARPGWERQSASRMILRKVPLDRMTEMEEGDRTYGCTANRSKVESRLLLLKMVILDLPSSDTSTCI